MRDKFKDLDEDFKDAVAQSSIDEIKKRMADLAYLLLAEKQLMEADNKLEAAKTAYDNLADPYRESMKEMRLKSQFCKKVLDDKGAYPPSKDQ